MNHVPDYQKATNAAYKILAKLKKFIPPIDVFEIINNHIENCKLLTYRQASRKYGCSESDLSKISEYGFSIVKDCGKRIILYNDDESLPAGCIRFTLAHEIGHAVLGHSDGDDVGEEKEANCFARNLLCPVPVTDSLELKSPKEYAATFNVSMSMANISYQLHHLDVYYIDPDFYGHISNGLYANVLGFSSLGEYYRYLVS